MNEIWRPIPDFPGYQVSDLGRVRSYMSGDLLGVRVLKPSRGNKARRAIVTLYRDRKPHYRLVARLVCEAFHGAPPSDIHQAAHRNGSVFNDSASNLRWALPIENAEDRDTHGTTARAERHYAAQFTNAEVRAIRATYDMAKKDGRIYGVVVSLARKYNVKIWCIEEIVYRRKWRSVA